MQSLTLFGLLFIPATVAAYWLLPRAWRPALLIAAGAALIVQDGWFSLLVWAALLGWLGVILLPRWRRPQRMQQLGLAGLLLIFFVYQYGKAANLFAATLGFAFVLLKAWHLMVEARYANDGERFSVLTVSYLLFPPTATLGPVQRFDAFRIELQRARWDAAQFARGLERLLVGYCKVVLLVQYLLVVKLDNLKGFSGHVWLDNYLQLLNYGVNLYLQFSGFCDIAIGFAALLGIRVPENFNFPFMAASLSDFWRRWHITVSGWCRDFVFTPIYNGTRRYLYASVASMLVLGVWHELSLRYLAWGLFHGAGMACSHLWSATPLAGRLRQYRAWRLTCWFLTLQFVIVSFALTSKATMHDTALALTRLLGIGL